jgi:hypothetical protein
MRALHGGRVSGGGGPGDKWARLFRTFRRVHGTLPNALGPQPFIAERAAGSLGRRARLFWSSVLARGLSLSVARLHAASRALLFHVEGMRMPDPGDGINNSNSIGEVLAAWIVTLLAAAIGVSLLAFHEPGTDDRRVPRWYDPPVAVIRRGRLTPIEG